MHSRQQGRMRLGLLMWKRRKSHSEWIESKSRQRSCIHRRKIYISIYIAISISIYIDIYTCCTCKSPKSRKKKDILNSITLNVPYTLHLSYSLHKQPFTEWLVVVFHIYTSYVKVSQEGIYPPYLWLIVNCWERPDGLLMIHCTFICFTLLGLF